MILTKQKKRRVLRAKKPSETVAEQADHPKMPLVILVTLGLGVFNCLSLVVLAIAFMILVGGRPVMVQTEAGEPIETTVADQNYRSPQVIQTFVERNLSLLFTWSGVLPAEQGEQTLKDPGVEITVDGKRGRIPTSVNWAQYGLTIENNFRMDMLAKISKMVPRGLFDGQITQAFEISSLSMPVPVVESGQAIPGRWKLQVVSTRLLLSRSGQVELIPFNREVFIRVVYPQEPMITDGAQDAILKRIRQAGLEIYAMRGLDLNDYQ